MELTGTDPVVAIVPTSDDRVLVLDGTNSTVQTSTVALVAQAGMVVSTTAALAAIGNAINTAGKYQGKIVFNSTSNALVVAVGATAGAVWNTAAGALAHTPV